MWQSNDLYHVWFTDFGSSQPIQKGSTKNKLDGSVNKFSLVSWLISRLSNISQAIQTRRYQIVHSTFPFNFLETCPSVLTSFHLPPCICILLPTSTSDRLSMYITLDTMTKLLSCLSAFPFCLMFISSLCAPLHNNSVF